MEIQWVSPDAVPAEGKRSGYYYKRLAERLAKSPNNWAIWTERCDGARYYEFRKRFPEIEFRKELLKTDTKQNRYKVYARYVAS
jgi:hypothetical protein